MSTFLKGIAYQPFPSPYNPTHANDTCIFFGSDIAYDPIAPLWDNKPYVSTTGSSCTNPRDDLTTIKNMGCNLVRLYDWEPRNKHLRFLDRCVELGIKVLIPISNYFLSYGFGQRSDHIPNLIKSFSNAESSDYHAAIAGIIFGNEVDLPGNNAPLQNCIDFTKDWVNIENSQFSGYSMPILGHPLSFAAGPSTLPCWQFWDSFLPELDNVQIRNLPARLFLAPQPYNDGDYLYVNCRSGKGYIDLTWDKYKKPILIPEMGYGRDKPNYQSVIKSQFEGGIQYAKRNPEKLLGECYFQFADKVWMEGTSEGSFGVFSHSTNIRCTVTYGNGDFTHKDSGNCDGNTLQVDELTQNPACNILTSAYSTA
jgi:hypothetical protein